MTVPPSIMKSKKCKHDRNKWESAARKKTSRRRKVDESKKGIGLSFEILAEGVSVNTSRYHVTLLCKNIVFLGHPVESNGFFQSMYAKCVHKLLPCSTLL